MQVEKITEAGHGSRSRVPRGRAPSPPSRTSFKFPQRAPGPDAKGPGARRRSESARPCQPFRQLLGTAVQRRPRAVPLRAVVTVMRASRPGGPAGDPPLGRRHRGGRDRRLGLGGRRRRPVRVRARGGGGAPGGERGRNSGRGAAGTPGARVPCLPAAQLGRSGRRGAAETPPGDRTAGRRRGGAGRKRSRRPTWRCSRSRCRGAGACGAA